MTDDLFRFLAIASDRSLEGFQLSRLNHAQQLRKEIAVITQHAMEEEALAQLAAFLRERRKELQAALQADLNEGAA